KTGTAKVRVFNPETARNGWDGRVTAIQIVTDDSPFLVDSVSMAVAERKLDTHVIVHLVVPVARDKGGALTGFGDGNNESVMHIEIDRISDVGDRAALQHDLEAILADVCAAVGDWQAMR